MKFKVLDLFCDIGGFSLGLSKVDGFSVNVAFDNDEEVKETFNKNFPNTFFMCGNILEEDIQKQIIDKSKQTKVNVVVIENSLFYTEDNKNELIHACIDIVNELKPSIIITHNDIEKLDFKENEDLFIAKMIENGYKVNINRINAKHYGVAQDRYFNIFVFAKKKTLSFPKEKEQVTVKTAISDLAYLENGEGQKISSYINEPQNEYQNNLRGEYLEFHESNKCSKKKLEEIKSMPIKKDNLKDKNYRLNYDDVAPSLNSRLFLTNKIVHPILNRTLTLREVERLQSFNDDFYFCGNKSLIIKQICEAFPPILAREIAIQIANEFDVELVDGLNYELYLGNAYTLIDKLVEDNIKVNHIITDPPYSLPYDEENFNMKKAIKNGEAFDVLSWIPKYEKILDDNGSMIVFCSYRDISYIIKTMEDNNLEVKDIIVWKKTNPIPRNVNRRYVQDMKFAIWSVKKGAKWVFNRNPKKSYMRSLFETSVVSGKEKYDASQKSLRLMDEIVKIHTKEDDLIIDPFMGTGTTGLACLDLNRKFIGIEIDKKCFTVAVNRLNRII